MPLPPPKRPSKRTELELWLGEPPRSVGPAEWEELRRALAPVSDSYLRKLLRASGAQMDPLVEGVRQEDFAALERTLLALLGEERRAARTLIIEAKQHARWAAKRHPEKEEMILWMLTWLENPGIFPQWLGIRKETLRAQTETA